MTVSIKDVFMSAIKKGSKEKEIDENKATDIWNERYDSGELSSAREADDTDPIDYTQHDFLQRHCVLKPLTGIPEHESKEYLMRSIFNLVSPDNVLAVGSGLAHEEQYLINHNIVRKIQAYELSDVAVQSAKERIAKAGLSDRLIMHTGDVTKAGLQENTFDAVYVSAAIHHFFNIEEMMDFFYEVLKPGGILVYDEYVGPDHHIYHDKAYEIMDKINSCLDESLRYDQFREEVRDHVAPATLEWMLEMDPSEGVHSSMILPLTYQKFDVVQRYDYGGTIMRPFWVGILNNFDFNNAKDQTIAQLIGLIEQLMIDQGTIPSYHSIVAARKGIQDLEKPLLDNEMLSYTTHGYEIEKQKYSLFQEKKVLNCVNFSDGNWDKGVRRNGPFELLVSNSSSVRKALEDAKSLVISPEVRIQVVKFEEAASKIVITCHAEDVDRFTLMSPKKFWVSKDL